MFNVILPKDTPDGVAQSVHRIIGYRKTTGPRHMIAYEMAFPDFAVFSLEERVQECCLGLETFREMLENCPLIKKKGDNVFYYFAISFSEYVRISKESNMDDLHKAMLNGGGYVNEKMFHILVDNENLKEYLEDKTFPFVGCAEISLNLQGDVERVFFFKSPLDEEQQEIIIETLTPALPNARELLTPEVQCFLNNPTSNLDMLTNVLDKMSLENPELAQQVKDAIFTPKRQKRITCANCGMQGEHFAQCGRCKEVRYCGRACQVEHWKGQHGKVCMPKK